MRYQRERLLMGLSLVGLPALLVVLGIYPTQRRSNALRVQIQAAEEAYKVIPAVHGLNPEERKLLDDPKAAWRTRLPLVVGDQARLAHYHRVVGELQRGLTRVGTPAGGMRSSWDPIQASFTLAGSLSEPAQEVVTTPDSPALKVGGWTLEANIPGNTGQLFKALGAVDQVQPLLEPVGLRWMATPDRRDQHLILRNLILLP